MSALSRKSFRVELDDGTVFDVESVNADQLAYEDTRLRRKWPMITEGGIQRWHTFLAWSAARRAGLYTDTYERFTENAVDVESTDDDTAGEAVDPTLPGSAWELMVALAIATNTLPSQWAAESDEAIVTAVGLIERNRDG